MMGDEPNRIKQLAAALKDALGGRLFATIAEAANLLSVCPNTIRNAIYDGRLTGARMARNGPVRIWVSELAAFITACEAHSLPTATLPHKCPRSSALTKRAKTTKGIGSNE